MKSNELIADIFARMHRVERMGSGFKRIRENMELAGLPFPKVSNDEFFFIEFERPSVSEGLNEGLSEGLKTLLTVIEQNPGIKAKEIIRHLSGRPLKTIDRQIKTLVERKLIERKGSRKTGGYHIVRKR